MCALTRTNSGGARLFQPPNLALDSVHTMSDIPETCLILAHFISRHHLKYCVLPNCLEWMACVENKGLLYFVTWACPQMENGNEVSEDLRMVEKGR